jgi:hypothetical protein
MVLCALHNFIHHRANGAEDSFYQDADLERDEHFRSGSEQAFREAEHVTVKQDRSDGAAALRDRMVKEMWVDYARYRKQRAQTGTRSGCHGKILKWEIFGREKHI